LSLTYFPRFFFRYPDSLELGRPTLLHQASANWAERLSEAAVISANLGGAYGEADFTATQAVFGEEQIIPPEESVLRIARVTERSTAARG
jgi:hypothetical protein